MAEPTSLHFSSVHATIVVLQIPLYLFNPPGLGSRVPSNWNATTLSLLPPRPPKALLRTQLNRHPTGEALGDPHHPWSPPLHCGATIELVADLWDRVINALIEEYILW